MIDTISKFLSLISPWRMRWVIVASFAVGVSFLDALAAVLVFALFGTLTAPEQGFDLPLLGNVGRLAPGLEPIHLLLAGGLVVAGVFLLRSAAYLALTYLQHRIANNAGVDVGARLVQGYLAMPYAFHLQRNSAELVRNAFDAIQRLVSEVLIPVVRVISEGLILLAILAVLIATQPAASAFTLLIFGPAAFLLLRLVQPRLQGLGRIAQDMAHTSLQSLQQAFTGLRDIQLLGRQSFFVDDFVRHRRQHARARYLRAVANELPKITMETLLVLAVAAFLTLTILSGRSPGDSLAVLGLFGYAAFRALPSLNKVLSQLNSLKFAGPTIDDLHEDLTFFGEYTANTYLQIDAVKPLPIRQEIALEEVSYRYQGSATDAIQNVSLSIPRNTTLGIVGPTGGGKTTLTDLLTGLLQPTSGRVTVDGLDIHTNIRSWQRNLGVVPQVIFLLDDSLRRNIAFGLPDSKIDENRVLEAVHLARLDEFVRRLPHGLNTVVGEHGVRISGGQRQRVAIARALYRRPEILLFDEATSALDTATERRFLRTVTARLGARTIVMVAHRITTVRDCDRIIVVQHGRITDAGTYEGLLHSSNTFRELATGTW